MMKNKILFIDDEADILNVYKNIFSKKGSDNALLGMAQEMMGDLDLIKQDESIDIDCSTFFASQGEEGVKLFEKELETDSPIKVVFIDMRMPPGIDGKETAKRIRDLDSKVEIVIVTAYSDSSLDEIVSYVGRPDKLLYLKKPFDTQEIRQFVLNLCSKYDNERVKDEFLSNVTHELNTPLASIIGFNQLMLSNPSLDDDARMYSKIIQESGALMKSLTKDLIDSIQASRDGVTVEMEKVDLLELTKTVYESFKLNEKNGISFEIEIKTDNAYVKANRIQLHQCLNNLIQNAFKFTKEGTVRVELLKEAGKVIWSVKDTGVGISDDDKKNIFKKFTRVENSHHNTPGFGLGLFIVKKIIDTHGGEIVVESKLDEGSEFRVFLSEYTE